MPAQTRPCEICGQPIDPERVEAIPETRLCTEHARTIAQYGGEFVLIGSQSSLSKPGSMKRNPGDVSITSKSRNTRALEKLKDEYDRLRREAASPPPTPE